MKNPCTHFREVIRRGSKAGAAKASLLTWRALQKRPMLWNVESRRVRATPLLFMTQSGWFLTKVFYFMQESGRGREITEAMTKPFELTFILGGKDATAAYTMHSSGIKWSDSRKMISSGILFYERAHAAFQTCLMGIKGGGSKINTSLPFFCNFLTILVLLVTSDHLETGAQIYSK